MPFTPTHILAVLPLWPFRRWLPFGGLAVGTMIPDISMFFPVVDYAQTHSPLGVFSACLPLGIAVYLLFDMVMRAPLVALMPTWFQARIDSMPQLPANPRIRPHLVFYLGLAGSIVIGAYTHQIWDAFTHEGRWGTKVIPSLNSTFEIAGYNLPGYKLFQYGSTFIGLPLLGLVTVFSINRVPASHPTTEVGLKTKILLLSCLCIVPLLVSGFALASQDTVYRALGVTIKLSGSIIMSLCVAYCIGQQVLANARRAG